MKCFGQVTLAAVMAASPFVVSAADNLLLNGDFSLVTSASGMGNLNNGIPTSWCCIQGQTDNASVIGGAMLFSTMGTHNANQHKYYVSQVFNASVAGEYTLTFDYQLRNSYTGYVSNGAKVVIDNWYSSAPGATPVFEANTVFSATYFNDKAGAWHLGQTVVLNLTAGNHSLYLGTLGASRSGDQAAVLYDNVSISAVTAPVPEPETYAMLLAGLGLLGGMVKRRKAEQLGEAYLAKQ